MTSAGEDVADRVLGAVRRARPHRDAAQVRDVAVAQVVGQRLEVADPAGGTAGAGVVQQAVGRTGRHQGGLVDDRALVAGRAAPRGPAGAGGHEPKGSVTAPSPTGRTSTRPSLFRSDPLTRIRNE